MINEYVGCIVMDAFVIGQHSSRLDCFDPRLFCKKCYILIFFSHTFFKGALVSLLPPKTKLLLIIISVFPGVC